MEVQTLSFGNCSMMGRYKEVREISKLGSVASTAYLQTMHMH
jgi:hypothetical protein